LIESSGDTQRNLADTSMLPVVMSGAADFQVRNLLATIAACRAFGVEHDVLLKSLINFTSCTNNPGRANLYRLNGGHVMIDYGHNAEAFEAICRMASHWEDRRVTGIITIPGDRDDSIIDRAARAAAKGFDKVIVREDQDLRGRQPGDVANIVCRAVREVAPATKCEVVLDEIEALQRAVNRMIKNEVIVVFYEKLPPVQKALQELSAEPVLALPPLKHMPSLKRPARIHPDRPRRFGKRFVPAAPSL
jgi:cyanophycin synthetase